MTYILLIFTLSLAALTNYGQTRPGFIDYEKVVQTIPDYLRAQEQIDSITRQFEDSLRRLVAGYEQFVNNATPHNSKLDATQRQALEDTLRIMETQFRDYQNFAQAKANERKKQIEKTLRAKITRALQDFCIKREIVCVVDREAVLYCIDCTDYTEDFVKYLNTQE